VSIIALFLFLFFLAYTLPHINLLFRVIYISEVCGVTFFFPWPRILRDVSCNYTRQIYIIRVGEFLVCVCVIYFLAHLSCDYSCSAISFVAIFDIFSCIYCVIYSRVIRLPRSVFALCNRFCFNSIIVILVSACHTFPGFCFLLLKVILNTIGKNKIRLGCRGTVNTGVWDICVIFIGTKKIVFFVRRRLTFAYVKNIFFCLRNCLTFFPF